MPPLHVVIDARLFGGQSGGIEQVVIGLASSLSSLEDGDERYTFLAYPKSHDWIQPYISGRATMLLTTAVVPPPRWKRALRENLPGYTRIAETTSLLAGKRTISIPQSDGTIERLGADVIHFPIQRAFLTNVPSIYHPHDLLYRHLPHLLPAYERLKRETTYRRFCDQAKVVSVTSTWIKQDLVRQFELPPQKIAVVPLSPVTGCYATPRTSDIDATAARFSLPEAYVFYPARTWPHKNHLKLLEALALIRDRDNLIIPCVCSGGHDKFFATIRQRIRELHLENQVQFPGHVSPLELRCLYARARCVVVPTLFEAASGPVGEAFATGTAVACSNVTSLPAQSGSGALLFDPHDANDIAHAIRRLWTDESLRQTLIACGRDQIARLTWPQTARHFRALYRQLAKRPLTDEDRHLLTTPPLL